MALEEKHKELLEHFYNQGTTGELNRLKERSFRLFRLETQRKEKQGKVIKAIDDIIKAYTPPQDDYDINTCGLLENLKKVIINKIYEQEGMDKECSNYNSAKMDCSNCGGPKDMPCWKDK